MAETKKMTKKGYFEILRELVFDRPELVDFIDHEIELLSKKNSKTSPSKNQIENEAIKVDILNALEEFGKGVTITELMTKVPYSNQKLSALVKQLVEDKKVIRTEDKRKVYFTLA